MVGLEQREVGRDLAIEIRLSAAAPKGTEESKKNSSHIHSLYSWPGLAFQTRRVRRVQRQDPPYGVHRTARPTLSPLYS